MHLVFLRKISIVFPFPKYKCVYWHLCMCWYFRISKPVFLVCVSVCMLVIFNMKSVWKIVRLLVKNISRGFCLLSLSLSFSCCLWERFCCSYIIFHSFGFRATYFFRGAIHLHPRASYVHFSFTQHTTDTISEGFHSTSYQFY